MINKIKAFDGSGNRGFTLIEMLIVIAVIAVLAGVVLAGVSGFQQSARDTRRVGDLRNTQNYLELFFNKCGHYPVSDSSGSNCGTPGTEGSVSWSTVSTALEGVTSNVPDDPGAGTYEYGVSSTGLEYVLKATFERENNILNESAQGEFGVTCNTANKEYCIRS